MTRPDEVEDDPPPLRPDIPARRPHTFVLLRELCEVHLLLDNVSTNPEPAVHSLWERGPAAGLPRNWLERICQISWPADGSTEDRAEEAALLILVKDYLNTVSRPATGMTIAFSAMVIQNQEPLRGDRRLEFDVAPTRMSLAETAYPGLTNRARNFRTMTRWVNGVLLFFLLMTCALSWYIAYGNALLGDLATAETALAGAEEALVKAEPDRAAPAGGASPAAMTSAASGPVGLACRANADAQALRYPSAAQREACREIGRRRGEIERVEAALNRWLVLGRSGNEQVDLTVAATLAKIMGTAILPFLYGLLGAGAAVVRSWSSKIKKNMLAPRDIHLSIQQLALGAIVGGCIGLFIAQGDSDGTLIGPVALSASAISFVAGFGVDAVFQALEMLINRLFRAEPAPGPDPRVRS